MIGVQVVYIGGIDSDLDHILYEAAGRDVNDEGCTIQGEGRRDMFWRCESESDAEYMAERLRCGAMVCTDKEYSVSIKSEDEHLNEKLASIEASFPGLTYLTSLDTGKAFRDSTEHPEAPEPSSQKPPNKNPADLALELDQQESATRLAKKTAEGKATWGDNWRDMMRSGRRFTRVERIDPITADAEVSYVLRPEPGWEWRCQNCKTYSLVLPSMVAVWKLNNQIIQTDLMKEWQELAAQTVKAGFKPPVKPTPATAPCPNCKYRPGAPE